MLHITILYTVLYYTVLYNILYNILLCYILYYNIAAIVYTIYMLYIIYYFFFLLCESRNSKRCLSVLTQRWTTLYTYNLYAVPSRWCSHRYSSRNSRAPLSRNLRPFFRAQQEYPSADNSGWAWSIKVKESESPRYRITLPKRGDEWKFEQITRLWRK